MSNIRLGLTQSLTGRPFIGDARFRLTPADWSKYLVSEQVIPVTVVGLKPNTVYRAFLNDVDVTSLCKQRGFRLGEGLRTSIANPTLIFDFYFIARENATTDVERAAADAILVGGVRTLTITSNDGTSVATAQLAIPQYARQSAEVIVKKTPPTDPNQVGQNISYIEIAGAADNSYYFNPVSFSYIQTFFADSEIVQSSNEVFLTSVDLFFRSKPSENANVSGNRSAGVAIAICEVENDRPIIEKTYSASLTYKPYNEIFAFGDASAATTFGFKQPLRLATGKFYGIVIIFEDPAYELWMNKVGNRLINTNIPSPGVNSNKDGKLFAYNTTSVFNSLSDTDIKFDVKIARFVENSISKMFVINNYEFFTVSNQTGNFLPGEYVWQQKSPAPGAILTTKGSPVVRGSGTDFTNVDVDQQIVLTFGGISQVVTVKDVVSATEIVVDQPVNFTTDSGSYVITVVGRIFQQNRVNNQIYLSDSTAINVPDRLFTVGRVIRGTDSTATATIASIDTISLDRVRLRADVTVPIDGALRAVVKSAYDAGGSFVVDVNTGERININNQQVYNVTKYDARVLSRSIEVLHSGLLTDPQTGIDRKSLSANIELVSETNRFSSPSVGGNVIDLFLIKNVVSNACDIDINGVIYDSEVKNNGIALAKHIGVKVAFANQRFAEDVRVFMTGYRPRGTQIRVYARVHNSNDPEPFDDKLWTPLEYVTNRNKFSVVDNINDFVEYELGLPQFSEPAIIIPGTFATSLGSETITAADATVSALTSNIVQGDVIRVYDPLFPDTNYQVGVVANVDSTTITLAEPIETVNVVGSSIRIEKVKYPNAAFNNINNNNIARYYNNSLAQFDCFDSMQVKIVMLADNSYIVPRIDQIQVLGVSA